MSNKRLMEMFETKLFLDSLNKGNIVGLISKDKLKRKEMKLKEIRRIRVEKRMFGLY